MAGGKRKKPSKELLQKYHVDYRSDTVFSSQARLLQSIWREDHLQLKEMGAYREESYLGNYLPLEKAKNEGLNFLSKTIFKTVKEAIQQKEVQSMIMPPRIWFNMLSSQPLCFNLFAELKQNLTLATKLFSTMFPNRVREVMDMRFEFSPGRNDMKYTNDRSAFDIFFTYKSQDNKQGFIGIEVKYAEHMRDKASSHKERYEQIMEGSGIFNHNQLEKLKKKPIQQIWRDHLLALSMYKINDDYDEGMFVLLYPENNRQCASAVDKYKETFLLDDDLVNGFYPHTLEEVVAILKEHCPEQWIIDFEDRYLNFSKIAQLESIFNMWYLAPMVIANLVYRNYSLESQGRIERNSISYPMRFNHIYVEKLI